MFKEGDVACGQADTVPNLERGRAAMPVGEGGLLGLGEGQFTGDGELYITNGVEVGRGHKGGGAGTAREEGVVGLKP